LKDHKLECSELVLDLRSSLRNAYVTIYENYQDDSVLISVGQWAHDMFNDLLDLTETGLDDPEVTWEDIAALAWMRYSYGELSCQVSQILRQIRFD